MKVMVAELDDRGAPHASHRRPSQGEMLTPIEEAEIIQTLNKEYGMTEQEIAMRGGQGPVHHSQ